MPKITTIRRQIEGRLTDLVVWYDSKKKFFYIKNLPSQIKALVEFDNRGETEGAISKALDKALEQYHAAIEQVSKVIRFRFSVTPGVFFDQVLKPYRWHNDDEYLRRERVPTGLFPKKAVRPNMYGGENAHGFSMDFSVVYKRVAEKITYHEVKLDLEKNESPGQATSFGDDWGEMPYSAEREAFFQNVAAATRNLAKRISDFVNQEDDVLVAAIDQAGALSPFLPSNL
jgi:hypothetical protein